MTAPVAPPEIFHRGGQMGPLKILGWHTKTINHNFTIISEYDSTVVVNRPVENYQKDLRKLLLIYFGLLCYI